MHKWSQVTTDHAKRRNLAVELSANCELEKACASMGLSELWNTAKENLTKSEMQADARQRAIRSNTTPTCWTFMHSYVLRCVHVMLGGLLAVNLPASAVSVQKAPAPEGCAQYPLNHFGPFDYRTAPQGRRDIVEDFHFTPQVEQLRASMTGAIGGDISYTLGAFPNHPRAIVAMMRLTEKLKQDPAPAAKMSLECYFLRGIRFAPDDLVFRMHYAFFLISRNRLSEAVKIVDQVVSNAEADNAFTHFNAGMLYFDMKEYDKALAQAHRVMALGFERQELRERLTAIGRWVEPPSSAASAPSPAPGASASAASQ